MVSSDDGGVRRRRAGAVRADPPVGWWSSRLGGRRVCWLAGDRRRGGGRVGGGVGGGRLGVAVRLAAVVRAVVVVAILALARSACSAHRAEDLRARPARRLAERSRSGPARSCRPGHQHGAVGGGGVRFTAASVTAAASGVGVDEDDVELTAKAGLTTPTCCASRAVHSDWAAIRNRT